MICLDRHALTIAAAAAAVVICVKSVLVPRALTATATIPTCCASADTALLPV
jgi:hypothetical protein